MQNFNKFYNNKHTGRLLHWKPSLGFADIKMSVGEAKHELQTSTFQMVILLLFNNTAQLTFGQLQQQTQISEMDLKCNLIPLLHLKLLLK
jgi:cullin 3